MLEKKYKYTISDNKTIEQLILDDNVNINHMILPKGEGLPIHFSNSNVYMIVVSGKVTLLLDDQEEHSYSKGNIINIPFKTKMNVSNKNDEIVELFVVKAPAPDNYKE